MVYYNKMSDEKCKAKCEACNESLRKFTKTADWNGRKFHKNCKKNIMQKIEWFDFRIKMAPYNDTDEDQIIKERAEFIRNPKIEKKKKPKKN
jgi:TPP-dependent 2-oxoacid decarboxylase